MGTTTRKGIAVAIAAMIAGAVTPVLLAGHSGALAGDGRALAAVAVAHSHGNQQAGAYAQGMDASGALSIEDDEHEHMQPYGSPAAEPAQEDASEGERHSWLMAGALYWRVQLLRRMQAIQGKPDSSGFEDFDAIVRGLYPDHDELPRDVRESLELLRHMLEGPANRAESEELQHFLKRYRLQRDSSEEIWQEMRRQWTQGECSWDALREVVGEEAFDEMAAFIRLEEGACP